jgi:hypothetical protein
VGESMHDEPHSDASPGEPGAAGARREPARIISGLVSLASLILLAVGGALFLRHHMVEQREQINEAEQIARDMHQAALRSEHSEYVSRLQGNERRACVLLLDRDEATNRTSLLFVETRADGRPLPAKVIGIRGLRVGLDALTVPFARIPDAQVIKDDGQSLSGRGVVLYYRMFGDGDEAKQFAPLDEAGVVPVAYRSDPSRGEKVSAWETDLWTRVWELASDSKSRAELGVRVLPQDNPWGKLERDRLYEVRLSPRDGLSFSSAPLPEHWRAFRESMERVEGI